MNKVVITVAQQFFYPTANPKFENETISLYTLTHSWPLSMYRKHFSFLFGTELMIQLALISLLDYGMSILAEDELLDGN